MSLNRVRVKIRRMIALNNGPFATILTFVFVFIDYPLLDSVFRSPPKGWSKSQSSWIAFNISSAVRKTASYLLSQEKELLESGRRRNCQGNKGSVEPLVSVIIPTYRRANILVNRTVPSVLNQTHKNLELIIVGDHCTDDTERMLKSVHDKRVRFINLKERGCYPEEPILLWYVAGVMPVNVGLKESKGDWIAHLDDDDEFSPHHIKALLKYALDNNFEMVYAQVKNEAPDGEWSTLGAPSVELGNICRSATLYRGYLREFSFDIESWKKGEPADFNLWRRMKKAGVQIGFLNEVVGLHHKEGTTITHRRV